MIEILRPFRFSQCKNCVQASSYIFAASAHARKQIRGAEILSIKLECHDVGFIRRSKTEMYMKSTTCAYPSGDIEKYKIFDGEPRKVKCLGLELVN